MANLVQNSTAVPSVQLLYKTEHLGFDFPAITKPFPVSGQLKNDTTKEIERNWKFRNGKNDNA